MRRPGVRRDSRRGPGVRGPGVCNPCRWRHSNRLPPDEARAWRAPLPAGPQHLWTAARDARFSTGARHCRAVFSMMWSMSVGEFLSTNVLRAGKDAHPEQLRRRLAAGELVKVAPGRYMDAARWETLGRTEQHQVAIELFAQSCRQPVTFSHLSAATLWGIPYLGNPPKKPEILRLSGAGGIQRQRVTVHHTSYEFQASYIRGLRVTVPARTISDLARTQSFASALMSADHALRTGLMTRAELEVESGLVVSRPLGRRATDAMLRADGTSGSPGESLSRARFHQLGVPPPKLQRAFSDSQGLIGYGDFFWEHANCVGEFDGRVKYGRESPSGMDPADVVYAEKIREDRLRALGLRVVRWTWEDAWRVFPLEEKLRAAGVLAGPRVRRFGLT